MSKMCLSICRVKHRISSTGHIGLTALVQQLSLLFDVEKALGSGNHRLWEGLYLSVVEINGRL